MEIVLDRSFTVSGDTFKEVRDKIQEKIEEFLKGTKGAQVRVSIVPFIEDHTIAGFNEVVAWECHVEIKQKIGGDK